ncbi:hypothetical protein OG596_35995 [Streptomyces sp. NBC_01102]|nr:hypothetical protein OG596_35995 [Streptomyces sp. NBC_01102]
MTVRAAEAGSSDTTGGETPRRLSHPDVGIGTTTAHDSGHGL